jgi:RNA polymerase sigma-70 factor (ECF subfamily)
MDTDAELVGRAKTGNEKALEELLRRYQDRIYNYLLRMLGNHADAEDVTEEACVKVIRSLHRYSERGRFKSWFFRIAHREGLKNLRARRARTGAFAEDEAASLAVADTAPDPHEQAVSREAVSRIEQAVSALPPAERETVALRVYADLPFKDIARVMGCSINTALGRMRNANIRLRRTLDGN